MSSAVRLNQTPDNQRLLTARQRDHRANPTPAENHIRSLLDELQEHFIFQKGFCTTYRFFLVDFYLPRPRRLCLEVDGGYHNQQPAYDRARDRFLTETRGLRVLRLRNEDALRMDARALREALDKATRALPVRELSGNAG